MYVSLRETPKAEDQPGDSRSKGLVAGARRRIPATVIGLGMVSLLTDVSSESVAAVLPLYLTVVLGFGPLAYGFIDGINQAVSALVRLAGGWWADSTRRPKPVATLGYAGSALSRFGLLLLQGFWPITAMITVDRLGKGLRTGPRDAMIAAASDPRSLGRNFGVHRALDTTGALIGPLLAFAILLAVPYGLGGYKSVFAVSAAFAVIGVAVLVLAVPGVRRAGSTEPSLPKPERPHLRDLIRPRNAKLLVAAGLLGLVTIGDGFIYLALADSADFSGGGIPPQFFPLLFVGTSATYLLLAVPFGKLADRLGRWKVFLGGQVMLLGAYLIAAGGGSAGLVGVIGILALLGLYYAATDGVLSALAAQEAPESGRASGIAAAQTVVAVARFGASVGFGVLWQFTDQRTALLVVAVGLLAAIPVAGVLLAGTGRKAAVS
jgi:MFS family permease